MKKLLTLFAFAFVAFMANAQSCPDDNHPHAIDLGLPSGTLWACCNVGADKPDGYGGYYAWGEVEEKDVYDEVTYQYCTGEYPNGFGYYTRNRNFQNIGSDIAGTQYDVAHVKWGGSWVMPNIEQCRELLDNCSYTWIFNESSIKNGGRFTGPNGVTIFLPAAGERLNSKLYMDRDHGIYWSSTHDPAWPGYAHRMGFHFSRSDARNLYERREGLSIRPVISSPANINLPESLSDTSNQPIYNLYGIKVADNAADMNTLPPGIYIVNGKKFVVK